MNTRSENRFFRKDIAILVALVIASFGTTEIAFAQSGAVANTFANTDASEALPTLVDPAGIIDPELLSILNSMSNIDDFTSVGIPDEIAREVAEQQAKRINTREPEISAAMPITEQLEAAGASVDASPSIIDPPSVLRQIGVTTVSNSSEVSDTQTVSAIAIKDEEESDKPAELESFSDSGASIDPHLPTPELPEIVLTDVPLPTLRFSDMLALALVDNPGVIMANERVIQAVENSNQVGAFRYPSVAATSAVGPEYNDPVASEESGVATTIGKNLKLTLTHQLYDGGTSRSKYNRSQKLVDAAEAEAQIELESLLLEIVVNYVDYWRYQVELSQAENFVNVMNDLVDDLNSMFKAGAVSKLEVDFARARVASARGARSEAGASMNNAFSELEYLVPGLSEFTANSPEKFSDFILLTLEEYLEKGAASNSGFITNQMNIEATQLKVRAARGGFKPTVNVELSGSYIDDEGQPSEPRMKAAAKFLLNYTLYNGGERRAAVRRAQAQLREFESERIQLERLVFREIDQSFNNITASRLALDAVNDEIIAHEELQRLNRQNLALGTVNIMELIDVEERLFNAHSRKYEVLATMYQEYFTLLVSAGFTKELLDKYELELATNQGS
jgi:outer membrane protein